MSELRNVSSNPHVRSKITTQNIMCLVLVALLPAAGFGIYNFGLDALIILALSVASCVIAEVLFEIITKKPITVGDLSAAVTGLLLGMNLPSTAPWWLPVVGGFFAIIIVKMLFGGLGQNFMNPALGARCFLVISFPAFMNNFVIPDVYTSATPLTALKGAQIAGGAQEIQRLFQTQTVDVMKMVIGRIPGVIGETSMIAIVIGACILIMAGVIDLRIPGSYIVSFVICLLIFGPDRSYNYISAQLAGGGLMLGAFFMATDYVSSPITDKGKYVYGIFLGIMTAIFRVLGASGEGVSYAIILGNLVVPLIERFTIPRAFGIPKEAKKEAKKA